MSEKGDQTAGPSGPAPEVRAGDGIHAAARMGAELAGQEHPDDGAPEGDGPAGPEALWAEVVGARAGAFLPRFRRFEAAGGAWVFTWNWPCLFFGPLWFLYRKMYAWAAALIFAEMVLMPAAMSSPGLSILVMVAFKIGLPACGHWLYYRHVGKVIAGSREAAPGDGERAAWRGARGGASWAGPAVVLGVGVIAVLWAVSASVPGP